MTAEVYDVLGFPVALRASDTTARAAVASIFSGFSTVPLPPGAASSDYELTSAPDGWIVRASGALVQSAQSLEDGLATLEWHVVSSALARRADLVHLHGAALRVPDSSSGLVLAGQSGCGKTTLALGLMARAFLPFSDDAAVIDPRSTALMPLPRAFHVDEQSWRLLDTVAPDAVARPHVLANYYVPKQWADSQAPVQWIVFPAFGDGPRPELVRLPLAEAVQTILSHTR